MSEIQDLYEDKSSEEIMMILPSIMDKQDKADLLALMRQKIRIEETDLREAIKQEKDDSKEDKKLMQKTQQNLMATRKEFLEAYREMNKIITQKSMLKHLEDFMIASTAFKDNAELFAQAINEHIEIMQKIRDRDNG